MPYEPGIRVDQIDDEWILRRTTDAGVTRGIRLSAGNLLALIQSAPFLQDRILATLPGAALDLRPVFSTVPQRVEIDGDAMGTEILLRMIFPNGLALTYSLPIAHARTVARGIDGKLLEMENNRPVRQ